MALRLRKKNKQKTEEQLKKELKKQREKQRKQLILTRYGQKQKRHARQGVESCFCAAMSVFVMGMMILNSYALKGEVGTSYGLLALIVLLVSILGVYLSINGFKERDKNYITCKFGVVICSFMTIIMVAIFIRGLL